MNNFTFRLVIASLWLSFFSLSFCEFTPNLSSQTFDSPSTRITYFDDSTTVILVRDGKLSISYNDGVDWEIVKVTEKENVDFFIMDPFHKERAIAFNNRNIQFMTNDKGATWQKFELDTGKVIKGYPKFKFNAEDRNYVLVDVFSCENDKCDYEQYYTTDGFKNKAKLLNTDAEACMFAKSSNSFEQLDKETIFCKKSNMNSYGHVVSSYIVKSSDFFKTFTEVDHSRRDSGNIIDLRVIETFIVALVQNDKFNKHSKISLLVSKDGINFEEAEIEVDSKRGMIDFLPSSPLSIVLSIQDFSTRDVRATLYMSDSSGLKFKKIFEDNIFGIPTKVETIDGIWIINLARKKEETDIEDDDFLGLRKNFDFEVYSKISIDNGKSWRNLVIENDAGCKDLESCSLHLFTTMEENGDNLFVTGPTPGILMGIGNKGKFLSQDFSEYQTWISRDGGLTWEMAIDSPVIFSFADQGNIILGVGMSFSKNMEPSSQYYYSTDQGKTWIDGNLDTPIFPTNLLTTIDGTSTKFILTGLSLDKGSRMNKEVIYTLDFNDVFNGKTCDKGDFEEYFPRTLPEEEPLCIFGHREKFQRRKQDAKCLVNKLFEDVKVIDIPCDCEQGDFECAPGFKMSNEEQCIPDRSYMARKCQSSNKKEFTLEDKVLVSGNTCKLSGSALKFVKSVKIKCSDYSSSDEENELKNKIITKHTYFDSELSQYLYLEDEDTQENVLVRTTKNTIYASNDGGVSFIKLLIDDPVLYIKQGSIKGQVVLITEKSIIYLSNDGGNTFKKLSTPSRPAVTGPIISFHSTDPNKFIWYSTEGCDYVDERCQLTYYTKNGGKSFHNLKDGAGYCEFIDETIGKPDSNLIYCTKIDLATNKMQLVSSDDYFKKEDILFDDIVGFALTGNFVFVAAIESSTSLKAKVTLDGETFANADFPVDFKVDHQQAYTVLGSESHAIFLHVTTNNVDGREFGSILKSNSNGTSYVQSLADVNRNTEGFVDFDKIEGIEGLILSNTVENTNSKDDKKLKTQITHNDGAEWTYMAPPAVDSEGKKFSCIGESLSKCSLNLHGFTERVDYRDTFSSSSAVGLMIGVGNVGDYLGSYNEASTFITRDGGITWREIKKGVHMWEYGDGGTILVLVNSEEETNVLSYSLDEGDTWNDYEFSEKPVKILDLATVPSDTSRKFLIFANKDRKQVAFSIDFTDIYSRQCQLDLDHPDSDDFEYWSPKHPNLPDNCLFGHETKFLRRAVNHNDCFIGSAPLKEGLQVTRNCSCTRRDYECDYNFYRDSDGTCKLVKGLSPGDHKKEECKVENAFEYYEPTGYRKIPLSTCIGGKEFDKWNAKPCPGKEKEFNKHYGNDIGGGKLLILIVIPFLIFIFSAWFVYDRGIRRNGGFERLGQIRLDEDDFQPIENNTVDKVVNKIIRGGLITAAGTFALFKAIKKMDSLLLEKMSSLIFRRQPGHRNYVQVPDFENEDDLFGDNDDLYDEDAQSATMPNTQFYDDVDESDVFETEEHIEPEGDLFNIDEQSENDAQIDEQSENDAQIDEQSEIEAQSSSNEIPEEQGGN